MAAALVEKYRDVAQVICDGQIQLSIPVEISRQQLSDGSDGIGLDRTGECSVSLAQVDLNLSSGDGTRNTHRYIELAIIVEVSDYAALSVGKSRSAGKSSR